MKAIVQLFMHFSDDDLLYFLKFLAVSLIAVQLKICQLFQDIALFCWCHDLFLHCPSNTITTIKYAVIDAIIPATIDKSNLRNDEATKRECLVGSFFVYTTTMPSTFFGLMSSCIVVVDKKKLLIHRVSSLTDSVECFEVKEMKSKLQTNRIFHLRFIRLSRDQLATA
jgi:hypothetical protein